MNREATVLEYGHAEVEVVLITEEIAGWLVGEWVVIRLWCVTAIQTVPDGRFSDGGMVCVLGGLSRHLCMGLCRS